MKNTAGFISLCVLCSICLAGCAAQDSSTHPSLTVVGTEGLVRDAESEPERTQAVPEQTVFEPLSDYGENDDTDPSTITGLSDKRMNLVLDGIEYFVVVQGVKEIHTKLFGQYETVMFVPAYYFDGPRKIVFFLMGDGRVLYTFPATAMSCYSFHELTDLYIGDIDGDGMDDVIIISECLMQTFPITTNQEIAIYLQRLNGFANSDDLDVFIRHNVGSIEVGGDSNDWHPSAHHIEYYNVTCVEILNFIHTNEIDWSQFISQ